MDATTLIDRLLAQAPFAALIRGTLDWFFEPAFLNTLAAEAADTNYTRAIHFADLVALLLPVVFQDGRSVRSAYRADSRLAGIASLSAFYAKLTRVEPDILRHLVRGTADRAAMVAAGWPTPAADPIPGVRVVALDGNHLAATDRRIDGLTACTALPGLGLVVREYATGVFTDLLPIPDAYAREVSHAPDLLRTAVRPADCVVADREFCAAAVFAAVEAAAGWFVIRHRKSVHLHPIDDPVCREARPDRVVWEYRARYGETGRVCRCVRVDLVRPNRSGDRDITVLTNLSADQAGAGVVADVYGGRRAIEGAFHELAMALHGEVRTLAHPAAGLLCFALAAAVYNLLQVARRAIAAGHGAAAAGRVSPQLLCEEVSLHLPTLLGVFRAGEIGPPVGADIGVLRGWLLRVVGMMDLDKYERCRGGPPGSTRRRPRRRGLHESTQRVLDARKIK